MNKIRVLVAIIGITIGIGVLSPVASYAESPISDQCADADAKDTSICKQSASPNNLIKNIVNVLLFIIGAISVVMIIVGGLLYVTSAGDSGGVTRAKATLTYAIVGLIVSFLAFAIVNFVFGLLKK